MTREFQLKYHVYDSDFAKTTNLDRRKENDGKLFRESRITFFIGFNPLCTYQLWESILKNKSI